MHTKEAKEPILNKIDTIASLHAKPLITAMTRITDANSRRSYRLEGVRAITQFTPKFLERVFAVFERCL